VVLNAFPYGSGHILVLPKRHVSAVQDLSEAVRGLFLDAAPKRRGPRSRVQPRGMNVGMNLGQAAGAGIPKHYTVTCCRGGSGTRIS